MITRIPMNPGEHWWGGTTGTGECPLTAESEYHKDFRTSCENQTMPFFVSDQGRYIWSDLPFKVDVTGGEFVLDGGEILLRQAGTTLREAYLEAQKNHFPCDGKKLPDAFFRTAQYNTWMEFTYYPTQQGVIEFAEGWISHGYEPGVFIIDEGWHGRYGVWEFDRARFPNPKAMVDRLHELGFTVLLWVVPYVCADGPEFVHSLQPLTGADPEMAKNLYLRNPDGEVIMMKWWNGCSTVLNLANPYDAKFLDDQLQHLIDAYGVDGFKFDGGTPAAFTPERIINGPLNTTLTAHELNGAWNAFGRRYEYHEYKDTYKGGGFNCIQRLRDKHHTWDDNGIDLLLPCALNCGMVGHPFICPDMIGGGEWKFNFLKGFHVDEELFVRMAQCSALFPMMQFSWAPWRLLSPENQALCVEAAQLHKQLSDEILALVRESEISGEPILRPLEYNNPHRGYADVKDQFMLGKDILVAPVVTKGTRERRVVFPSGRWTDSDGNLYEGNTSPVLPAPLEKLLWFRRAKPEA